MFRVTSRCTSAEEFVARFRDAFIGDSMFLQSPSAQPVGEQRRFCITLANGEPILAGVGLVLDNSRGRVQMKIVNAECGQELLESLQGDFPAEVTSVQFPPSAAAAYFEFGAAGGYADGSEPGTLPQQSAEPAAGNGMTPANPFTGLDDTAIRGFVECSIHDNPAPGSATSTNGESLVADPVALTPAAQDAADVETTAFRRTEEHPGKVQVVGAMRVHMLLIIVAVVAAGAAALGFVVANVVVGRDEAVAVHPQPTPAKPSPVVEGVKSPPPAPKQAPEPKPEPKPEPVPVPAPAPVVDSDDRCDLSITTRPGEARVYDGEHELGETPLQVRVDCGVKTLKLVRRRYETVTETIETRPGVETSVDVKLERPTHSLRITSSPSGATVRIGGRSVGKTPLTTETRGFKKAKIELSHDGYKTWSKRVYVRRKQTVVKALLEPDR